MAHLGSSSSALEQQQQLQQEVYEDVCKLDSAGQWSPHSAEPMQHAAEAAAVAGWQGGSSSGWRDVLCSGAALVVLPAGYTA